MNFKLNNRGWGFTTFIVYLAIFVIFIIIVTVLAIKNSDMFDHSTSSDNNTSVEETSTSSSNEEMDYEEIEKDLESAAYEYQKEYLPSIADGDIKYVTVSKLEELKLLDNLTNGEVLCTGYAKITGSNGTTDFKGFINCGDYITEGYNADLDN